MPSELSTLKKRTISIINIFRKLYPESLIFKDVTTDFISNIDEDATSGFHELYLKCKLFQHLASNLNDVTFDALSIEAQDLVEMLFNPALEHDLLKNGQFESLDKMLSKYGNPDFDSSHCAPFWENRQDFNPDELREAMSKYLRWYEEKKESLYKNIFPHTPILSAPNQEFISEMHKKENVDQGEFKLKELEANNHLGTTGLACCIALIGIQRGTTPTVGVCHAFCDFEETLIDLCEEDFQVPRKDIGVYLIGGYPIHFADYLPIIFKNEFNIIDVRLGTSVQHGTACVVTSESEGLSVYYHGTLSHAPKKRPLSEEIENEDPTLTKRARLDSEPPRPSF